MPNGIPLPLMRIQYRLSRSHNAGVQIQRYNRVILFNENYMTAGVSFIEGFDAFEFITEQYRSATSLRKHNLGVYQDFDFDRLRMIGSEAYNPTLRSKLSLTPGNAALKVNNEFDIFGTKFQDIDAVGLELDNYNSSPIDTVINVNFHDRDVRSIGRQRNILTERHKLNPTPAPEPMTEQIMEPFAP